MSTNLIIQYTIVGAILAAAVVWVIYKAVKAHRHRKDADYQPGCSSCAFMGKCESAGRKRGK